MVVTYATAFAGWNITSTGALLASGFMVSLCVERTRPVLASRTVTLSPGFLRSGEMVLVTIRRSIPGLSAMPWGQRMYGGPG